MKLSKSELFREKDALFKHIRDALELSKLLGVRTVTLTGLLAWATGYGLDVIGAQENRADSPAISTGHAVIASAYLLNIERILQASGRSLAQERVAYLDLSSLGLSTLRLMLGCLPHPQEILMGDMYNRLDLLQEIQQEMETGLGFRGRVRLLRLQAAIPPELYDASVIIGPTNVPALLDVASVKAGTLLVGTSCVDREALVKRFREQEDLLFTTGGVLRLPSATRDLAYLPREMTPYLSSAQLEVFNSKSHPYDMPACAFSGLLAARFQEVPPTVGLIDGETAIRQHAF